MKIRRLVREHMVLSSEDFKAGELVTHSQSCLWLCGESRLAEALLSFDSKGKRVDPHTAFACRVLGIRYEDFDKKIKKHSNGRQAAKPPNFGFPGGMGDYKLVLQQRKQGPDTPCEFGHSLVDDGTGTGNKVPGFKGLRFCVLMGAADRCGEVMRRTWGKRDYKITPTCLACLECAQHLKRLWKEQWPENEAYFEFVQACVEHGMTITGEALERWPWLKEVFYEGEQLAPGEIMQHVSGRIRNVATSTTESPFCSAANGFFQGLLADIAKEAHRICVRECYDSTVRVSDMLFPNSIKSRYAGGGSPLLGSRIPVFQHDELIGEHPASVASDAAWRISEVMRDVMRWRCPDLADAAEAEPTLMPAWYKGAERIDHRGRLAPWTPDHNPKTCVECRAA